MSASHRGGAAGGTGDTGGHGPRAAWDGVLVFRADGTVAAGTRGWHPPVDPPIEHLSDLQRRFRQPDGMPIEVSSRARHVAVPVSGGGPRLALIVEPLEGSTSTADDIAVVVGFLPFRDEDDPDTLQRALGSVLAHELRTPMTTVYGGAELLSSPTLSDATRRDAAESVVRAAEQLYRVIEDVVLLVRWSLDNAPALEPVLLQPILRAAVRRHGSNGVAIALDLPASLPAVAGTDSLVEHLVRNLVGHAVASTPSGGTVTVAARRDDEWIELSVSDDGGVLSDEERARAFELFAPTRRSVDPSGANLSMVVARRVVERLGGEIQADQRDHGGRVVVRLQQAVVRRAKQAL